MRPPPSRPWQSWASSLVVVCISLVLLSGMVRAAHFHPCNQAERDCSLCVASHSVAAVAAPVVLDCNSYAIARLITPRSIDRPRRAVFFRLASRPPPPEPISHS